MGQRGSFPGSELVFSEPRNRRSLSWNQVDGKGTGATGPSLSAPHGEGI